MASEWVEKRIEELALPGGVVGGPFGSELVRADYTEAGVPVIRGGNLSTGVRRFVADEWVYVSEAKADALSKNSAVPGDIVVTQRGTLGQVGIVPASLGFERFVISQSQMRLRCDPAQVEPLFVYYWLLLPTTIQLIEANGAASGVPHINLGFFRSMQIRLPHLSEQRAIASVLGALDDKIDLNRRMSETLEEMARALFKSWFNGVDPVDDSVSGDWINTTLGEALDEAGGAALTGPFGSALHASDYRSEGVPVVMPQDIREDRISTAKIARIDETKATELARFRLQPGDVVFSRRGDVERRALVTEREAGWLCGTGCLMVRPGRLPFDSVLLFEYFGLPSTREWLVRHAVGATMPNLNTGILRNVPLRLPSVRPQEEMLRTLFEKREVNAAESRTLAELRDTLLPKLMSGELRVRDAEKIAGKVL